MHYNGDIMQPVNNSYNQPNFDNHSIQEQKAIRVYNPDLDSSKLTIGSFTPEFLDQLKKILIDRKPFNPCGLKELLSYKQFRILKIISSINPKSQKAIKIYDPNLDSSKITAGSLTTEFMNMAKEILVDHKDFSSLEFQAMLSYKQFRLLNILNNLNIKENDIDPEFVAKVKEKIIEGKDILSEDFNEVLSYEHFELLKQINFNIPDDID